MGCKALQKEPAHLRGVHRPACQLQALAVMTIPASGEGIEENCSVLSHGRNALFIGPLERCCPRVI